MGTEKLVIICLASVAGLATLTVPSCVSECARFSYENSRWELDNKVKTLIVNTPGGGYIVVKEKP